MGLGSRNRRAPVVPLTPGLRGQGTSPGAQQASWARMGWEKYAPLLSCSSGLGRPLPPASPDLPSLPPMPPGPMRLWGGGRLGGQGTGLGLSRLPVPRCAGQSPSSPLLLFPEGPSCLPLLISSASGVPILSGLHFSFPLSPPTSYRFILGFLPSPWASLSPTSGQQAP